MKSQYFYIIYIIIMVIDNVKEFLLLILYNYQNQTSKLNVCYIQLYIQTNIGNLPKTKNINKTSLN